jgi:hypothetical protein
VGFVHVVFDEDVRWGSLFDNLHVTHGHQRTGVGTELLACAAAGRALRVPACTCACRRGGRGAPIVGSMRTPVKRAGRSVAVWLAVALAAVGGVLLVASVLVAFLVADHSSSDSSASSVIAIGLGGLGFLAFILSGALLGVVALARLWRRVRRPVRGEPASR